MKIFILIISVTFFSISLNSQQINENNNGYVQIVNSKLKQKEIYSKLKEWIALNYKKPEEVITLNTDNKIIIRGLIPLEYIFYSRSLDKNNVVMCYISSTLIFSIKDYKFKMDFTLEDIETEDPYLVAENWFYEELISPKTKTKEQYRLNKNDARTNNQDYLNYMKNKNYFDYNINNLFSSVKKTVNSNEDW